MGKDKEKDKDKDKEKKEKGDKEKKEKGDKEKKEKGEKEKDKDKKEKDKDKKKEDKKGAQLSKHGSTGSLEISDMDHRKNFKEGQRAVTPPVADAARAFYESLLEEIPDSKIAIRWCVEYGVMPLEKHMKLLKKYNYLKEK